MRRGCEVTDAALRSLLLDCLRLWDVAGTVTAGDADMTIETADGVFSVSRADAALRPARWFLQTPERQRAGRPPRASASIVGLLTALRNAVGGDGGQRLRIGGH